MRQNLKARAGNKNLDFTQIKDSKKKKQEFDLKSKNQLRAAEMQKNQNQGHQRNAVTCCILTGSGTEEGMGFF